MEMISINNRKVILELRYNPVPSIIDNRGIISDKLIGITELECKAWKISNDTVEIVNSEDQNKITKRVFIGMDRLSFIDEYAINANNYDEIFSKIYNVFTETLKKPKLRRIGCRIMGTYSPMGNKVNTPLDKFLTILKNDAIIEDFPVRDINLTITYSSGRYTIGPIKSDDAWVNANFRHDKKIQKSGFAIDTDNYVIDNSSNKGISEKELNNIFETSVQVENTLFEKLSTLYG